MGKIKFISFLSILVCISLSLYFCPEPVNKKGCTDPEALNYDPEAEEDDGTCYYCNDGDYVFYRVLSQVNINCFDYHENSPYQNQVFSTLNITQNQYKSCEGGSYSIKTENIIKYTNITTYTISFDFKITQSLNGYNKEYQGYVSQLKSGDTYELNAGYNVFYNVGASQITVEMNSITYN